MLRPRTEPCEIAGPHSCSRLDLDSGGHTVIALQNDVHFVHLLVPKMVRSQLQVGRRHQFQDFREREAFEESAEFSTIRLQSGKAQSARRSKQTAVEKMQLGGLHDPLQRVRVPGLQCGNDEDLLQQANISLPVL